MVNTVVFSVYFFSSPTLGAEKGSRNTLAYYSGTEFIRNSKRFLFLSISLKVIIKNV